MNSTEPKVKAIRRRRRLISVSNDPDVLNYRAKLCKAGGYRRLCVYPLYKLYNEQATMLAVLQDYRFDAYFFLMTEVEVKSFMYENDINTDDYFFIS